MDAEECCVHSLIDGRMLHGMQNCGLATENRLLSFPLDTFLTKKRELKIKLQAEAHKLVESPPKHSNLYVLLIPVCLKVEFGCKLEAIVQLPG